MSLAAGVTKPGELAEAPKVALKTVTDKPWLAIGIVGLVLLGLVLLEAWKPGALTGPIRRLLIRLKIVKEGT